MEIICASHHIWMKFSFCNSFKCACIVIVLQHLTEQLELDLSPLEYMMKCFPEIKEKEEMRKIIGRYGLTGKQQVYMWVCFVHG